MKKTIRIGTNSSKMALWQAEIVSNQLNYFEHPTEIIEMNSLKKEFKKKPIYDYKTFTTTMRLDAALLNNEIDIAVQSLLDAPVKLPKEIIQAAVLKRGKFSDVLLFNNDDEIFTKKEAIIGTSSSLCKAQWLYRYPNHTVIDNDGDLTTQLENLKNSDWDAAIFPLDDLKKLDLLPKNHLKLDWMLPVPTQATTMISINENSKDLLPILEELNDKETEICTTIERDFVLALNGTYSDPIGVLTMVKDEELEFKGAVFSPDGKNKIEFSKTVPVNHTTDIAQFAASFIINRSGQKIFRKQINIDKNILVFSTKHITIRQTNTLHKKIGIDMSDFVSVQFNRLKRNILNKKIENVIFTNRNAIDSILNSFDKSELDFKNIYCVGRRNKQYIEKNIGPVQKVMSSALKLSDYIVNNMKNKNFTYFSDNQTNNLLLSNLRKNNIELEVIKSYNVEFSPNIIEPKYQGILFFSPEAVQSYFIKNTDKSKIAFCINNLTENEAKKHFKTVVIATSPNTESLLQAVNQNFKV